MFHASRPLTAARASHYYEAEFRRGDYYTRGNDIIPGRWFGAGARELGYVGEVRASDFAQLLEGRDRDGREITAAEHGTGKRRAGWDFTVSADKSVSIVALVEGDERLIAAHDAAVERALEELQAHVQTRQRHGQSNAARECQTTARMVAATFRHESSRALDPQLHTHVVVANLTRRDDGEWRALEPRELFRVQKLATAVYRSEMARSLERLGYAVEVRKDGSVGIAGLTRDDLDVFSQRRAQVLEWLDKRGFTSREMGQAAAHRSRADKQRDIDRDTLVNAWRERARERGLDVGERVRGARRPERIRVEPTTAAREVVASAVDHLAERHSAFRRVDLERTALEHGMGRVTLDDVRIALAERHDLHRGGRIITTDDAVRLEYDVLRLMKGGRGRVEAIPAERLPEHLTREQAQAARHILETPDRVVGLEGKAGTGKSHTLAAVHDAAERVGWTVRAFAPTTSAVDVLRSSGLEATTVARLVREKRQPTRAPQLWIVDEAGLVSTRNAAEILRRAQRAGAKVVLVGDRMQHRAVEAGQPFAQLVDAGMKTGRLEQIHRQRDAALRQAVTHAARGDAGRAVLSLQRQGRLLEHEGRRERLQAAVEHYMQAEGRALVVTATNADRRALNDRIREARIAAGQVERVSLKAQVLVGKDLTRAERGQALHYDVGDHVTFRTTSKVYGVRAGQSGRVTSVDRERNEICVLLDGNRGVVAYNPSRLRGVDLARVEERRFAVGDRLEFRAPDKERGIANGSLGTLRVLDRERGEAHVELDGGRQVTIDLRRAQALDHGYVSTSYRAQGRSVDHTIALVDAQHASRELIYVAMSRGRDSATVITDDRTELVRKLGRHEELTRALDVEKVRLIDEARAQLPVVQSRLHGAMFSLDHASADRLRDERYELERRARPDIDQVRHHELLARRVELTGWLARAPEVEWPAVRESIEATDGRLYELRHGPRTELGSFAGRLPMRQEVRLHEAHRRINARADAKGWPETASPLTRELLGRLDGPALARVVDAASDLAGKSASYLPSERAYREELQRVARDVANLAKDAGTQLLRPAFPLELRR